MRPTKSLPSCQQHNFWFSSKQHLSWKLAGTYVKSFWQLWRHLMQNGDPSRKKGSVQQYRVKNVLIHNPCLIFLNNTHFETCPFCNFDSECQMARKSDWAQSLAHAQYWPLAINKLKIQLLKKIWLNSTNFGDTEKSRSMPHYTPEMLHHYSLDTWWRYLKAQIEVPDKIYLLQ